VVRSARGVGYGKRLEKKVDKSDFILLTQYGFYEMIKDPSKILLCKKCVAAMTFLRPPRKSCGQAARKKSSGRKKSQGGPISPEKSRYIFGDLSIFWAIFWGKYLKIVDTFCRRDVIIAVESDVKLSFLGGQYDKRKNRHSSTICNSAAGLRLSWNSLRSRR
jgi:hypothetical protein